MLNFSRTKIFFISLICVLAIIFAIPSFLPREKNEKLDFIYKILPDKKVNLGLDLMGGSQLVLEVDFEYYLEEQINNLKSEIKNIFYEESISSSIEIINKKIVFSVNENDNKSVRKIIKKLSKDVDFKEDNNLFTVYFSEKSIEKIKQNLIKQSIEIVRRRIDESGTKEPIIQATGDQRILLQVPGVENSTELKAILGKTAKMNFHFVVDQANDGSISPEDVMVLYDRNNFPIKVKKEISLNGNLLTDANPTYHEGQPAVNFRFNDLGTRKFAEITKDNIGKIFAIVLDNQIITAPRINSVINQGSGVISGSFTVEEANQVALLLRAGALPAPLKIIEERTVGPSLGQDSINSGAVASICGVVMVAIFMMLFYGFFGFVANVAMVLNIAIIISVLSLIGATLTLPGIAGIVLTMGMSVDGNVLIFERIKEEIRDKKSVFQAVDQGFSQALRTITDSNITTLIVAFFLYAFGNGPVKGFAVTLSIGIISSIFSAIILTRVMIATWLKRKRPQKLMI